MTVSCYVLVTFQIFIVLNTNKTIIIFIFFQNFCIHWDLVAHKYTIFDPSQNIKIA